MVAEGTQGFALCLVGAGQGGGAVSRGLEQHRGLAADDFHIGLFRGAGVAHLGQLQHFAFGDHAGSVGENLHHRHGAELDHHFERA